MVKFSNKGFSTTISQSNANKLLIQNIFLANMTNTEGFSLSEAKVGEQSGGPALANAGDVNKDGLNDIIIGAIWANSQYGMGYVVYGKPGGLSNVNAEILPSFQNRLFYVIVLQLLLMKFK